MFLPWVVVIFLTRVQTMSCQAWTFLLGQASGREVKSQGETAHCGDKFYPLWNIIVNHQTGEDNNRHECWVWRTKVRIYYRKILPIPKKSAEEKKGKDGDADYHSLGSLFAIRLWYASLSSIPMKRYLVNTEDCQSPLDCISRMEAPDW